MKKNAIKFYLKNIELVTILLRGFKSLLNTLYLLIKAYRENKININLKDFNNAIIEVLKIYHKNTCYNYIDLIASIIMACLYICNIYKLDLLKNGNLKINKKIKIFDIPTIMTCKHACPNCYAIKSEKIYQNTRIMRLYHLILLNYAFNNKDFYNTLLKDFNNELKNANIMRWHGAGDIFNKDYLFFILQVVTENKHVKFYTYSKQLDNNQIDFINDNFENFNIIKSLIHDKYINYGNNEHLKNVTNVLKENNENYYICKYNEDNKKEHGTCMGTCQKCLNCSNILFHIH